MLCHLFVALRASEEHHNSRQRNLEGLVSVGQKYAADIRRNLLCNSIQIKPLFIRQNVFVHLKRMKIGSLRI